MYDAAVIPCMDQNLGILAQANIIAFRRYIPMRRNYDIFERFPDGSSLWQACVQGQFDTQRKIQELAEHSKNEFFALDLTSNATLRPRKSDEKM